MSASTDPDDPGASAAGPDAIGLDGGLARSGLDLAGVLSVDEYDAIVPPGWRTGRLLPTARSAVILGSGGSAFYRAAIAWGRDRRHPLDEFCEQVVEAAREKLEATGARSRALYYWERRALEPDDAEEFADFVALARASRLGAPSRLGQLLSPVYGPWFAIRAVLLTEASLRRVASAPLDFHPCGECPAPCVEACHGGAVGGRPLAAVAGAAELLGNFDAAACVHTRAHDPACESRCDARLACPIGAQNRYAPAAIAHHMQAPFRGGL